MTEEAGDTFNFYLKFAKPLVLGLQDPSDRIIAAAWIQKLRNESIADENIRKDYLKLLLFALHRGKLCGPFSENPSDMETLDKFPEDFKVIDAAKDMLVQEEKERKLRLKRGLGASGDNPPYSTECSADLLEYAAAQDIPKFGVHAYYAVSFEPISKWDNLEKAQYPRAIAEMMEKSAMRNTVSVPTLEVTPSPPSASTNRSPTIPKPPSPRLTPGVTPRTPKSKSPKPPHRPKTPVIPVSPIDDQPKTPIAIPRIEITEPDSAGRTEQHFEARSPITWGSNLIDVNDPPERDLDLPDGDTDDFLLEEPPSDFSSVISDYETAGSPTRGGSSGRDMSAASLPYRTPPRAGGSPSASLPYRTPPRLPQSPTSPASLPYRTPPRLPESPGSPASLPYRTPPRMDGSSFGTSRSPQRGGSPRDDGAVIPAGSAASKDIIAEANMTLQYQSAEESDGAADISPSAFDHLYPDRRTDMPRTPPMFSKFKEMREGPGRTANYDPQMFGLTGEEEWQSAGTYQFEPPIGGSPSKPKRMQYRPTHKPIEQVFPGMKQTDEWSQMFFDVQNIDLVDDEFGEAASAVEFDLTAPPKEDYDSQIKDLLEIIQERKQESPIAAGIGTTTPKLSPIPRRTKPYGTEFPIFLEDMPTFTSPERSPPSAVSRSPSRASPSRSPTRPSTPGRPQSPVRDPTTDSFGLPVVRTHASPVKQPTPKATKIKTPATGAQGSQKKSPTKTSSEVQTTAESSSGQDTSVKDKEETNISKAEELQQKTDTQYAAIYEALIVDAADQKPPNQPNQPCANKSPPRTPTRRSPGSPQMAPPGSTVVPGWETPPHLKVQRERSKTPSPTFPPMQPRNRNELLNLESFPGDEYLEPPGTPPTPPRQFSYEEYADPFQRSPEPIDAGFQDDSDDYMPGLSSMLQAHEYVPYKEQPVTNVQVGRRRVGVQKSRKEERRTDAISESPEHLMLPSPERADRRTLDTSRMGRTPSPVAVPQDQNLMNFAEEYFVNEFEVNPQQQDMLRRVIRLIDDVEGEPLYKDPEMLYAEIASELPQSSGQDGLMTSPPRDLDALDEIDQLEMSPLRPRAPEPEEEYPRFDFQEPVENFMPQQQPYQLPIQQTSPRHRFTQPAPAQPTDADFQQFQQMTQQYSPVNLEDSQLQLIKTPSPERRVRASPESPPTPHIADFIMESITREPEPYRDTPMTIRRGACSSKLMPLHRHSRQHINRMGDIREVPPGYDEDLADFNYSIDRAREDYPWAQFIKGPKMQKPNIMSPVDEAQEFIDSPVPPPGRPRITKRMVRKRLNFDSVDPDPSSPERPKVVDMPLEPLPRIHHQPLPSPRDARRSPPRVVYAVGSPIKLDDDLNVIPANLSSPTARVEHLTRVHRDLLNEQEPLPMPDDLMGESAPAAYNSPAHLMDMGISDFLPSPQLKLPTQLEGWKTPPNLAASATPQMSPQALPPLFTSFAGQLSSEMPPQEYSFQQEELLESPIAGQAPYFMETTEETEWPSMSASPGYDMQEVEEPAWPASPPSSPCGAQQAPCGTQQSPRGAQQPPRGSPGIKKTTSKTTIRSPNMTKTTEIYKTEPEYPTESSPGYFAGAPDFQQPAQSFQPMSSVMPKSPAPRELRTPSPRQQAPPQAQYRSPRTPTRAPPPPSSPKSPYRTPPRSAWDEREAGGLMEENLPDMLLPSPPYTEENEVVEEVHDADRTTKTTHITKKTDSPGKPGQHYDFFESITETEGEPERAHPYASLQSADEYTSPRIDTSGNFINADVPMMERVEHLIADIPGGTTPPRSTSPYMPEEYTSPNWSPGLPIAPGPAQLDAESFPMQQFQSPQSPQSPIARSPQARSPMSRTSPGRQSPRASPNILAMSPDTLGVAALGEENFPEMMSPESSPRQSPARYSPPSFTPDFTPPRQSPPRTSPPRPQPQPRRYSPQPNYPDPNEMKQEIESHQYTEQHYDRNRQLMKKYVRSGKKVVPLEKGAGRPKLGIIADIEEPMESPNQSPEAYPMDAFDLSPPARSPPAVQWVSPPERFERQAPQQAPRATYAFTPPKPTYDHGMFGDESIYASPPPDLYVSPESMFSSQSEWYSAEDYGNAITEEQPDWSQSPEWAPSQEPADIFANNMMVLDDGQLMESSPPMMYQSPPGASPTYSPLQQSVREQQYTPVRADSSRSGQRSSQITGQYPQYANRTPPSAERNYTSPDIPEMIRFEPTPPRRAAVAPDYGSYAATPQHGIYQRGKARTQKMKRRRLVFDSGPSDSPPSDGLYDIARAPSPPSEGLYETARAPSPPSYSRQLSPQQMPGNMCSAGQPCYAPQRNIGGAAPQYHLGTPPSSRPPQTEEVIDETITYSRSGQPQSMTKTTTKESPTDSFMEYEYKVFDDNFDDGLLDTSDIPDFAGDDDDFGWLN